MRARIAAAAAALFILAACSDAEAEQARRDLVDAALKAERVYERAHSAYLRDWTALGNAFTPHGASVARDNYLEGRESQTPQPILLSVTYRRAVHSTVAYVEAQDAYDVALEAVEDAGAMELLLALTPTPEGE